MRLKHITFTGIDAKTDIKALTEIQREFPIAEFGVLTSYHWYENGNRYLDPQIIDKLHGKGLHLALHICGSAAHDAAEGKWTTIDKLVWGNVSIFKRIQLNLANRKDNPAVCRPPMVIGQEIIIQQRDNELPLYETTLKNWYKSEGYKSPKGIFSALLDSSGGRGIDTPLKVLPSSGKVGYAGGINPDNVCDKLVFLMENVRMGEFWIDMESGVRSDDWFDLNKVHSVLTTCKEVIRDFGRED